jgi:hypothetical protein
MKIAGFVIVCCGVLAYMLYDIDLGTGIVYLGLGFELFGIGGKK